MHVKIATELLPGLISQLLPTYKSYRRMERKESAGKLRIPVFVKKMCTTFFAGWKPPPHVEKHPTNKQFWIFF